MNPTNLDDDVLHLILVRLTHVDRLSLSVVSKYFQSHTNSFVKKLIFDKLLPSDHDFPKLLSRFTSVNHITIKSTNELSRALTAISMSKLKIEELEISELINYPTQSQMDYLAGRFGMVRVLRLNWFLKELDSLPIVEFVSLFPLLEEMDLKNCSGWSGDEIFELGSNAPNLSKMNFSVRGRNYSVLLCTGQNT